MPVASRGGEAGSNVAPTGVFTPSKGDGLAVPPMTAESVPPIRVGSDMNAVFVPFIPQSPKSHSN